MPWAPLPDTSLAPTSNARRISLVNESLGCSGLRVLGKAAALALTPPAALQEPWGPFPARLGLSPKLRWRQGGPAALGWTLEGSPEMPSREG